MIQRVDIAWDTDVAIVSVAVPERAKRSLAASM